MISFIITNIKVPHYNFNIHNIVLNKIVTQVFTGTMYYQPR